MNESRVLIHVWELNPEREGAAVRQLEEMLGKIAADPGFVSARVLQSDARVSIAVVLEMRSVEDRQRIEQIPEVHETLHNLNGAVNLIIRLYQEVAAYGA